MPHLGLRHEIVERAQCFVERHECVAIVQLQQVDMIAPEPLQAGFDRTQDVRAAEADVVRAGTGAQTHLRADQHARFVEAEVGERLAHHLFRLTLRIGVGGIDQIHALFDRKRDEPRRLRAIEAGDFSPDAAARAERHGTQREARNAKA